jgi:hypothetical protein
MAAGPEHIYVGTSVIADGFIQPAEGNAFFLIFDPEQETVIFREEIDGARSLITMGYGAGKIFFWTDDYAAGGRLFVYDLADQNIRQLDSQLDTPHNRPMVSAAKGDLYFAHRNQIVCLSPETETLEITHTSEPGGHPILAASENDILFSQSREMWQLTRA